MLGVLESCRVATIAVIAGACTSAGLAACGDMRIDTAAARIGFPIAKTLGNCLSMSNVSRLVTLFGSARTKDIIFIARLIEAPEALAHGLLNEVALDAHALQRCASELAQLLARHAPLTLEGTKRAVRRLRPDLKRDGGEDPILKAYMGADFREGMEACLSKRNPCGRVSDWGQSAFPLYGVSEGATLRVALSLRSFSDRVTPRSDTPVLRPNDAASWSTQTEVL